MELEEMDIMLSYIYFWYTYINLEILKLLITFTSNRIMF
jgi:hypothetical protein